MVLSESNVRLIADHELAKKHVLSFAQQPYLKLLFDQLGDRYAPLTVVVGAGVSMNAGLPSWAKLLANIVDGIEDNDLREMARAYQGEPLRRAEFILQIARRKDVRAEPHEFIRDGLFPKETSPTPGPLAESIARLVAARKGPTRLITTNFDELLEAALRQYIPENGVRSFGLNSSAAWRSWVDERTSERRIGVLHVHGILRQGGVPELPVVLTESQFLQHGLQVRQTIAAALTDTVGLFIGLSMTDPNLVGPLWESAETRQGEMFALSVADLPSKADETERFAKFAVESVRFLDGKLRLRPILLKSYSQMNQVLSDLSLASMNPENYRRRPAGGLKNSLYYGHRLEKAIKLCYQSIGCSKTLHLPVGPSATTLSENLRKALVKRNGPQALLRGWAQRYGVDYRYGQENFALHLWLRRLDRDADCKTYSLALMGSSAFESKEPWFTRRVIPIIRDTPYAAAQAVFEGNYVATNLEEVANGGLWRGVVAIPIEIQGTSSDEKIGGQMLDRVTVGALTLDSDHYVEESDEVLADPARRARLGVISRLRREDSLKFRKSLFETASEVLSASAAIAR